MNAPISKIQDLKRNLNLSTKPFLIEGDFSLTKTQCGWGKALIYRDRELERETQSYITNQLGSCHQALTRYHTSSWPQHFACRSLAGIGGLASGENIFINIIFPCLKKTFTFETQVQCATVLFPDLRRTIYLASLFHELGHRVGPFAVSPKPSENLKVSSFQLDVCGELYTDMLLIKNFPEFPELLYFVLMQRFFWFTRRDFKSNPLSAKINHDNDSWVGTYLWQKLRNRNAINLENEKFTIDDTLCRDVICDIIYELDQLGNSVLKKTEASEQQTLINNWMSQSCPKTSHQYTLPTDLFLAFAKCLDIPERPFVNSIVDLPISI